MSNIQSDHSQLLIDDEIDLKALFMMLWSGRWLIGIITGIAASASVVIALMLPNIYTANALLAPAEQSGGGMSALMQQYGGLASLAGVSLPGTDESSRAQLGMALITSRSFISDFVERRGILPDLMAVDAWDLQADQVSYDPKVYDVANGEWVRKVKAPFEPKPSLLEAHEAFEKILSVSQDKQTGYVKVSIEHKSPSLAAQWVNWLIEDVNSAVKAQDVAEAERSIEYLQEQVTNTSLADLQAVFFDLIQSQTETVMLAEVRQEYVFKTIDPAIAPEKKSKPRRALICILGTLLGGMLGVVYVLMRHGARSEPES